MPRGVYARKEVTTDDMPIDQRADIIETERKPEVILVDQDLKDSYTDELAFNEEPVEIQLEPGAAENAPTSLYVGVNGKGIEILINGRWCEIKYAPLGSSFTTKRKYVAVILASKIDKISTISPSPEDIANDRATNRVRRATSAVAALSVIRDDNPRGPAWMAEIRRRNMG